MTPIIEIATAYGTDLSSRHRAAELRRGVLTQSDAGIEPLTLDFAGVRSLSESFADEAFAVIVAERGEAWFREHLRLVNLSASVRLSILEAVFERCDDHEAAGAG